MPLGAAVSLVNANGTAANATRSASAAARRLERQQRGYEARVLQPGSGPAAGKRIERLQWSPGRYMSDDTPCFT